MKLFRALTCTAATLACALAVHASISEKFSHTYPFSANGKVSLDTINGSVEIVAWDRPEVVLEAEKTASSEDGLALLTFTVDASNDALVIKTRQVKKWKFWSLFNQTKIDFRLKVPAGIKLDKIDVVNAEVTVRGIQGFVNLDAVNGTIVAEGLGGGGRFDTVNGRIQASFAKVSATDRITLDTVNGSCELTLPANAAFILKADTVNGSISSDFPITVGKARKRALNGTVNGGGAEVILDSVNGGLSVRSAK
jgi:hypothetical protein